MGAGGQLAVREGARAPLPKLDVGALVQHPRGPELPHVQGAPVNILPPLQNHAGQAVPGQEQGGKQPRRAHPHHHRGQGRPSAHRRKDIGGPFRQGNILSRSGPHHGPLLGHGHLHGVHIADIALVPGVNRLADNLQLAQRPGAHPQRPGRPLPQPLLPSLQRQGQVSDPYHSSIPSPGPGPAFSVHILPQIPPIRKPLFPHLSTFFTFFDFFRQNILFFSLLCLIFFLG